jgi:hypothetical protein
VPVTIRCFTSFTLGYLPKSRVLAASVKRAHPDWQMYALICEPLPDWFDLASEPFDAVLTLEELQIPGLAGWVFAHRLVEVCTGAKGPALAHLLALDDTDAVVYLDPDIRVYRPLTPVIDALATGSVVLTPHLLEPERHDVGVFENEMTALVHGVYNLGFLAVRSDTDGLAFARWWSDRLVDYCFDDRASGLFTDQRWCDLVPALFERHSILRSPACNVAPWNVGQRIVSRDESGAYVVDAEPLVFVHFSGVDGDAGREMIGRHAPADSAIFELWAAYTGEVAAMSEVPEGSAEWPYERFVDGTPIIQAMRDCYRHHPEVRAEFADPFAVDGPGPTFLDWWRSREDRT